MFRKTNWTIFKLKRLIIFLYYLCLFNNTSLFVFFNNLLFIFIFFLWLLFFHNHFFIFFNFVFFFFNYLSYIFNSINIFIKIQNLRWFLSNFTALIIISIFMIKTLFLIILKDPYQKYQNKTFNKSIL